MSKRFGRNQKRAFRTQVEELKTTIETLKQKMHMDQGLLSLVRSKLGRLEDEIAEAKRIIGERSVLFPPTVVELESMHSHIRLPTNQMPIYKYDLHSPIEIRQTHVELPVMLTSIQEKFHEFHCVVDFGKGVWGYAISHESLRKMPPDIAARRISEQLARAIVSDLRKAVQYDAH